MFRNFFRWLFRLTTEAGAARYDTVGYQPAAEPYSRAQIDRMAAEQGVRFPHSHGPHTIG